jgi:hypothetical protein
MWNTLVKEGVAISNSDCLKGLSGLKVDAKRARLQTIVSGNVDINLSRFYPTNEAEAAGSEVEQAVAAGSEAAEQVEVAGSESDDETEDVSVLSKGTDFKFVFDAVGDIVAVPFAGGAWYVGEVKKVLSD